MKTELIPLNEITGNPWQTRAGLDPDYVLKLADDIYRNGLMQAPKGRRVDDAGQAKPWGDQLFLAKKVQLAFGHNRLAAYRALAVENPEFRSMPVIVEELSDEQMALMAWSENSARKDLTPIEEATAIQRDIETFGWTQEVAGGKLGLARATVANKLRLLKLPENIQKAVDTGKISERQASALLPLMDLPQEALDYGNKNTPGYVTNSKALLQNLEKGSIVSSDEIRNLVEKQVDYSTIDISHCPFKKHAFEGITYLSAECANCTWRMKSERGDRCKRPDCYQAKAVAWAQMEAVQAIEATGLQLATELGQGNYQEFYGFDADGKKVAEIIYTQGCQNLRIHPYQGGFHPKDVMGYAMVCQHGEGGACTCYKKALKDIRKNDTSKIEEKEKEHQVEALVDQVAMMLAMMITSGDTAAWRTYALNTSYDAKEKQKIHGMTADALAAKMVHGTVNSWVGWQALKDPISARARLEEELAKAGLKNPWTEYETPAEQAWNKYLRISKWAESLVTTLPKLEAVQGNIDNLYRLLDTAGLDEPKQDLIKQGISRLEKVLPEVQMLDEKGFEPVRGMLTVPPGDVNFKSALEKANPWAIRYALGLLYEAKQHETRIQALKARLEKTKNKTLVEIFAEEEARQK